MMKEKPFDCVKMKWDIQRRLEEKYAGRTESEARRLQDEKADASLILGSILARLRAKGRVAHVFRRGGGD